MIEDGHIELGAIVVNNGIGFTDKVIYLLDHFLPRRFVNRIEHHLFLAVPFSSPAKRIALFNDVVGVDVLVPKSPGIDFMRGGLDI